MSRVLTTPRLELRPVQIGDVDVDEPNVTSVRILEKLGMRKIRRAIVAGRPLLYYEQHRNDDRTV